MKALQQLVPAFALTIAAASAQNVTVQAVSFTPIQMSATTEVATQQTSLPLGQILTSPTGAGAYAAVNLMSFAGVSWNGPTQVQDGAIDYRYLAVASVEPSPAGTSRSAAISQHDVLVSIQPTGFRLGRIVVEIDAVASAGQAAPQVDVDVYDDGIVDGTPVNGGHETGVIAFDTSAIPVRITVAGGVSASGASAALRADVLVRVLPVNDVVIDRTSTGCNPGLGFQVNEAFGHNGVRLGLVGALNPHVVVLGLTAQPTVLGAPAGLPCLVFPAPDVVLLGQPGGIDLPIPAAVRPFGFHAQAVALSAFTFDPMFGDSYYAFAF